MKNLKEALPEVGQRLILPLVLFVIALVGLWLGDETREWQPGRAAVGALLAVAILWVADPFFQLVIHERDEEVSTDGDVV